MSANAILVVVGASNREQWVDLFRAQAGGRSIRAWPDHIGNRSEIAYACVWVAPHGALVDLPGLKLVANLGAGVDRLLADPALPDVPIVRATHPDLAMRVTEYVVLHTLRHHRRQPLYEAQQRERIWRDHPQPAASEVAVGIMGLGVIGSEAARVLARIGFKVAGWSATPKAIGDFECFHGAAGLGAFLARTDILICLLPATPDTRGILNRHLFAKLKQDGAAGSAYLINAGRGSLQINDDILAAIENGTLAGATLDVFPEEPLPLTSPLWSHPKITITPHNAGDISPAVMVGEVMRQIERLERGEPLTGLVDRMRGY
jgi:glyoxylate/hydroxypyruvate reductase A